MWCAEKAYALGEGDTPNKLLHLIISDTILCKINKIENVQIHHVEPLHGPHNEFH